jgi:uncharacterized protein YggE
MKAIGIALVFCACPPVSAQTATQVELKIEPTNRTLTVSAEERVTVDPEIAILHIGFDTPPEDAKTAYADGSRISNAIIGAIKQVGIAETSIRSESQRLDRDQNKPHKFKLVQQWTVKVPPERAAEILDVAVTAGATDSGRIDWTVRDEKALEQQALEKAAGRARENAETLAKGMGVHPGSLVYVSNQTSANVFISDGVAANNSFEAFADKRAAAPQALSIEPRKVSRTATVYAVYSIE